MNNFAQILQTANEDSENIKKPPGGVQSCWLGYRYNI